MLRTIVIQVIAGGLFAVQAYAGSVEFISSAKPMPTIVIGQEASACEKFAAEELAMYLQKITGRKVDVKTESGACKGKIIAVGASRYTESIGLEALSIEEFIIDISEDLVNIVGGRREPLVGPRGNMIAQDRGTLYGVYEFLEQLGVRWYRPEPWGHHIPKMDTIKLWKGRKKYAPAFEVRYSMNGYRWHKANPSEEQTELGKLYFTRMRLNTNMGTKPKYGGYISENYSHSYMYHIPPARYFKKHPEYFALIDGKRSDSPMAQLCLSNPDVQRIIAKNLIGIGKRGCVWGASIEANDGGMWCECEKCQAWDDPNQRTAYGRIAKSNRVFKFNNIVASMVKEKVPFLKVCSLAYNEHVQVPTRIKKIESNIAVRVAAYASASSDYSRDLRDPCSVQNANFLKQIEGWAKICDYVTTYEYWSGYTWSGPMPIIHTMMDRLREYRRIGIKGCYNMAGNCISWGPQGLNMYMFCKLMWNPNINVEEELNLYYKNYYGPAEKPMKAYHELLEKAATGGPWFGSGGGSILNLYQRNLVHKMGQLLSQAQDIVKGNELYEKRLYGVWAGYEYVRLLRKMEDAKFNGQMELALKTADELEAFFFSQKDGWVWENCKDPSSEPASFLKSKREDIEQQAELMTKFKDPRVVAIFNKDWRFAQDPADEGKKEKWFSTDFDDSKWGSINTDDWWENQGHAGYDGMGWYRKSFSVQKSQGKTIIYFGGVDGDADIWLNGKFLSRHEGDVGDDQGWQEPFWIDMTEALSKGANQITVRVNATNAMGGIWKGVQIIEAVGMVNTQ